MLENPFLTPGRAAAEDDINLDHLRSIQSLRTHDVRKKKKKKGQKPLGGPLSPGGTRCSPRHIPMT